MLPFIPEISLIPLPSNDSVWWSIDTMSWVDGWWLWLLTFWYVNYRRWWGGCCRNWQSNFPPLPWKTRCDFQSAPFYPTILGSQCVSAGCQWLACNPIKRNNIVCGEAFQECSSSCRHQWRATRRVSHWYAESSMGGMGCWWWLGNRNTTLQCTFITGSFYLNPKVFSWSRTLVL